MLKKISFCFVSFLLMLLCIVCPIISITFADTNFTPTYTFNGSNLGFVSAGIGTATVNDFTDLNNYNITYDGFNTRLGFSTSTTEFGLDGSSPIDFNLTYQCNNRNFYLKPLARTFNVDSNLINTNVIVSTLDSSNYSFTYTFRLFDSLSSRYFNINNLYDTGTVFCSGFVPCNYFNTINGTSLNNYWSYNYFAFKLGDMSDYADTGIYANNGKIFADNFRTINVVSIELGSSINWSYGTSFDTVLTAGNNTYSSDLSNTNIRFDYVLYTFDSGCQFLYVFGCQYYNVNSTPAQNDTFYWDYRRYYVTSDIVDNVYYNDGFSNGYNSGYDIGYQYGTNYGYDLGLSYGQNIGYNEGVADAGNYTFFSLISAVIDAPINAFKSLFNFNFLGVNLLDFVTGLITLAFAIWILRLVL